MHHWGIHVNHLEDQMADTAQQVMASAYQQATRRLRNIARGFDGELPRSGPDDGWVDETALNAQVDATIVPQIADAAVDTAQTAAQLIGMPADPAAAIWTDIATRRINRLTAPDAGRGSIVKTISADVGQAINAGFAAGESVPEIAARVATQLGVTPGDVTQVGHRALTIARTEANGLSNEIAHHLMGQSGLVQRKRWYSVGDSRTRDSHQHINGQEVAFNETFDVNGHPMLHPHDPAGPASETVNCRCRLIPIVNP